MSALEQVRETFVQSLWEHYKGRVPDAQKVEGVLRKKGQTWLEDHMAFRTLPGPFTGAHILQDIFEELGYVRKDSYHFEDKQLNAFWMEPSEASLLRDDLAVGPKIFVSELIPEHFPPDFQAVIADYVSDVKNSPLDFIKALIFEAKKGDSQASKELADALVAFFTAGPLWRRPMRSDYELLRKQSEYAAWTLLFGSTVNHFTVSAHLMESFASLQEFSVFLEQELGLRLNVSGGAVIKGSPELKLEQCATLANQTQILFQDDFAVLPYAFVEFVWRFPLEGKVADGRWSSYYQGFVTSNADKIFESTNVKIEG